ELGCPVDERQDFVECPGLHDGNGLMVGGQGRQNMSHTVTEQRMIVCDYNAHLSLVLDRWPSWHGQRESVNATRAVRKSCIFKDLVAFFPDPLPLPMPVPGGPPGGTRSNI